MGFNSGFKGLNMKPSGDKHRKYANSLAGMYTKEFFYLAVIYSQNWIKFYVSCRFRNLFSSIGSEDCCLVQQNAKMSVLQRIIENKKGRKEMRSKGILRKSKLITENEELKFFSVEFFFFQTVKVTNVGSLNIRWGKKLSFWHKFWNSSLDGRVITKFW